jgi:hypothetical protein
MVPAAASTQHHSRCSRWKSTTGISVHSNECDSGTKRLRHSPEKTSVYSNPKRQRGIKLLICTTISDHVGVIVMPEPLAEMGHSNCWSS